jgi:hypothetical protein
MEYVWGTYFCGLVWNVYMILSEWLKGRGHMEDLSYVREKTLKWILYK